MILGIVKEIRDRRVALVPDMVAKFKSLGLDIMMEKDAGTAASFPDSLYQEVTFGSREEVLKKVDILISADPLAEADYAKTNDKTWIISMFAPYFDDSYVQKLKAMNKEVISMDMIPRTTLAQAMDVLSSMASVAGYRAVLVAAMHLPRYFPMLITAAGSIRPARVLVLGAGVAGLQAIATARRLGAAVEAFDTRAAAKEEVLSLGAKFVEVEGAKDDTAAGGYAVEQSEEFLQKQRALVQERAAKSDVIITTAQVRGRKAPLLVPEDTLLKMKPGSVVVDLAASTGGNCALTEDGKVVEKHGIKIVGDSNLAAEMPQDASFLFSNNIFNFFKIFIQDGNVVDDKSHEIIHSAWLTKNN
ncbi:MAG: NAD(P) transhydrogenase subunit alpha [Saprospiraceae bacterium]|nr:NAD(P) transhydrogenase subunit alpha [Saprospiraceae bacterium]